MVVFEVTDINRIGETWTEYVISHYWYFLYISFRFKSKTCDGCHDMTQKSVGFDPVGDFTLKNIIIELTFGSWIKTGLTFGSSIKARFYKQWQKW